MGRAGVSELTLWEHPITWQVPTEILYAGGDHLVSRQTVERFAAEHGATLTVLEGGEHWFHTEEQLAFLDGWVKRVLRYDSLI